MDGDTGHIKMTRVFRTSIITQLNKIKKNFLTPNGKFNQKFYKKNWNMFALLDGISLHMTISIHYFRCLVHNLKSYKSF